MHTCILHIHIIHIKKKKKKIEYWMRKINAIINQVREYTLLLMENKIDIRFILKRQLVR